MEKNTAAFVKEAYVSRMVSVAKALIVKIDARLESQEYLKDHRYRLLSLDGYLSIEFELGAFIREDRSAEEDEELGWVKLHTFIYKYLEKHYRDLGWETSYDESYQRLVLHLWVEQGDLG